MERSRHSLSRYLFVLPTVVIVLVFLVYPVIFNVNLSLRNVTLINFIQGNLPYVGWNNYVWVLNSPIFYKVLSNTLVFTVGSMVFQFIFGLALALLFNKRFPLNRLYQGFVMLPWFVPILVSGAVFRWFFADSGAINGFLAALGIIDSPVAWITSASLSLYSVTLANIWLGIPFNFILLHTGLKSIPEELYECADIDGATEWEKVRFITLPMLKPVIVTTLMLGAIFTIKVFDLVWVVTGGGPGGSSHLFTTWSYTLAFDQFRFGRASVVALLMLILISLVTIGLQRVRVDD